MYSGKRVLVAGGTGAIGIPLVKRLVEMGAEVWVVSMDSYTYARDLLPEDAFFSRADLTSAVSCSRVVSGMDYVFNLVGIKGSVNRRGKSAVDFVSWILFQTYLMDAAFHSGVKRFLFTGSICSYPVLSTLKHEDQMWDGAPLQNDRYAGLAKRIGEIQGETYLADGIWDGVRIVRPSNCYGSYDDFNEKSAQVIPALIAKVESGVNPVKVLGNGEAVRDFIHIDDVVEGILLVMEKGLPCVPVNIGSGRPVTIKQLAHTIGKASGKDVSFDFDSNAYSGDPVRASNIERITSMGFKCKVDLEEGIRRTFEWYRNNRDIAGMKGLINV